MMAARKTRTGRRPVESFTKTQWRQKGRGIRKGECPCKTVKSARGIVDLYKKSQTISFTPFANARNYLLDLFAHYPTKFGYRTKEGKMKQVETRMLLGGAYPLMERGFNVKSCEKGIKIGKDLAESFHVLGQDNTKFVCIDLDNHTPSPASNKGHLELVQRIVRELHKNPPLGIQSTFFQYRCIDPTGIHIWIVLKATMNTKLAEQEVRDFLRSLNQDDLNKRLRESGLSELEKIELRPGGNPIAMPGAYRREVFTTKRLKVVGDRFDCVGLANHIKNGKLGGDVVARYRELLQVSGAFSIPKPIRTSVSVPTPIFLPATAASLPEIKNKNAFWTYLTQIALKGVLTPDDLFDSYLKPLAQCLYFREYWGEKDKSVRVENTLRDWIKRKHNGYVSRITKGDWNNVSNQIKSTIKNLEKSTTPGVKKFYENMRRMDFRFPDKKMSLIQLMKEDPNTPPSLMIDCKGCISTSVESSQSVVSKALPNNIRISQALEKKISVYVAMNVRKEKASKRFESWVKRFISEIGLDGSKVINNQRLHALAEKDPDSDSSYLKRWKKHLVEMKIIDKGWEKNVVRGRSSSKYTLQPWVVIELEAQK